jgi:F1F0 ATPase subunit 2
MPHLLQLALVLLAGMALGLFYFGGLAWTVRRLVAGGGVLLTVGSFLVRGAVLLAGFWLLSGNRAEYWIACLVGFTAVRIALSKAAPSELWFARREDSHASHH